MEISKFAVILAHEDQSDHKNITNDFRIHFCNVFVHAKMTMSMECQKM